MSKWNCYELSNYYWHNNQQLDGCKISSDGVPNGSGTLTGDLGWINIWNPWSTESDANLDNSTCIQYQICTVQVLLFFPITLFEQYLLAWLNLIYWVFRFSARADMICPFWGHLILSSCSSAPCLLPTFWSSWEMPAYLMKNKSSYSSSCSHP